MFTSLSFRQRTEEEVVTEADVEYLKVEISKLQKQLHQIVDQEIAVNNEACGVATNGIVKLHIEKEQKTKERCRLNEELHRETETLKSLERQYEEELDTGRKCQEDIVRLRLDMEEATAECKTLQAEIDQSNYFREQVDNETYYRLLADVQNLETEKERDTIKLRHLNSERQELQTSLDQLTAERDAFQVLAQKYEKELQDERMTLDMYKAHHETLQEHAERLGVVGKMDNVISSFKGFFHIGGGAGNNETEQPLNNNAVVKNKKSNNEQQAEASREKVRRRFSEKSLTQLNDKSHRSTSPKDAVGGIAYNTDSIPSADFFKKTPKIFKIGGAGGGGGGSRSNSHPDLLKAISNNSEREITISDETSSAQSSITMSDGWCEVTASLTESLVPSCVE